MANANTNIEVVVGVKNDTEKGINSVQKSLGSLGQQVDRMQPTFQKMAAIGTAAFAGISAVVYKSVQAAGEAAKVQAQLGAVLKSTGGVAGQTKDSVLALSAALQKQTTFGDEAITSAQNMLLTFTNIKGNVFPEATKTVLDMATAMGGDLQGSAIQLGKALNNPIDGISALTRVGVTFTDKQKQMIESLVNSGKTMEAQQIILKELATEFGGSAAAQAETFAGKIQQLKERVGDLQEAIGNALIPIIEKVTAIVGPLVEQLIAWAEKNPEIAQKIIEVGLALSGLVAVAGALGLVLPAIIGGFTFLATPVGLVTVAVLAVVGAVVYFKDQLGALAGLLEEHFGLVSSMQQLWQTFVDTWNNSVKPVWDVFLAETWPQLKPALEFLGMVVGTIIVLAFKALIETLNIVLPIIGNITGAILALANMITGVVSKAINMFKKDWEDATSPLEKVLTLATKLSTILSALPGIGGVASAVSGFIGSVSKVSGKRALGGSVSAGQQYLVGERGPELFTARTSGQITPSSMATAGGPNITINITGNSLLDASAGEKISKQIMDELRRVLKI